MLNLVSNIKRRTGLRLLEIGLLRNTSGPKRQQVESRQPAPAEGRSDWYSKQIRKDDKGEICVCVCGVCVVCVRVSNTEEHTKACRVLVENYEIK